VNPAANCGWVRPLAEIRRVDAPLSAVTPLMEGTVELLRSKGFDVRGDNS
jgi:hypothetical protein